MGRMEQAVPRVHTQYKRIDHIAIAVRDLEEAIGLFTDVLGFELIKRFEIRGKTTGMILAELELNKIKFVLTQGTEPESQVSRLIENNGPGVAHIALEVDDVAATASELGVRGLAFDTGVINGPGLQQIFSTRCKNSGLSFEFIKRSSESSFLNQNIQQLFDELERTDAY